MNGFKIFLNLVVEEVEKELNVGFPAIADAKSLGEMLKNAYREGKTPEETAANLVKHWRTFAVH